MEELDTFLKFLEKRAEKHLDIKIPRYKISKKLKSKRILGLFQVKNNKLKIKLNKDLILSNFEKYKEVIIHEFSHMIIFVLYGYNENIRSHGKEWKNVMRIMGAKEIASTTQVFEKELGEIIAICKCKEHYITKNRATRIKNGTKYLCRNCGKKLKIKDENE